MNVKVHTLKYIISDFFTAILAWIMFNHFRKKVIESAVYGYEVDFQFNNILVYSAIVIGIFWISLYFFSGYYYKIYRKSRLQEFSSTLIISIMGNIFLFFILLLDDVNTGYKDYYYSFLVLLTFHFIFTYIPRNILTSTTISRIRRGKIGFNTILIGSNGKALEILSSYTKKNNLAGYRFVGFVNVYDKINPELTKACCYLGNIENLDQIILQFKVEEIIIAIESHEHKEIENILNKLLFCNASVKIIPDLFEILIGKAELALIKETPLIHIAPQLMPVWERNLKYLIDKIIATSLIIILSPLYIVTALGVKLSSKGPIIYKQTRVGLYGKEFTIYKFRSMIVDAEKNGPELSYIDDKRVTRFGQFMRRTRLDEIPQFFNVLFGDMSLVGPRPERKFFIEQIIQKAPEYMILLKTRPGITSLGQVKYGYAENIEQMIMRLKYDIVYMKNMSLYFDFKILIYTVLTLIKQNGK